MGREGEGGREYIFVAYVLQRFGEVTIVHTCELFWINLARDMGTKEKLGRMMTS